MRSSCNDFDEWHVEETSTVVEATDVVTHSGAPQCTDDLVPEPHTVRLAEPLGTRRLVGYDLVEIARTTAGSLVRLLIVVRRA